MTALVLVGVAVVAVLAVKRVVVGVLAAFVAFVFVPEATSVALTGGLNLGALVVLAVATLQLATRLPQYLADLTAAPALSVVGSVFVAGAAVTAAAESAAVAGPFLTTVVTPPLGYLLVQRAVKEDRRAGRLLGHTVLGLATIEAGVSLAVQIGALRQPYLDAFEEAYWWTPDFQRALGTMDHPLTLGLFLAAALPLATGLRLDRTAGAVCLLLLCTIVATQSRAALVAGLLGLIGVVARRRMPFLHGAAVLTAGAAAVMVILAVSPSLLVDFAAKLADDDGSADARFTGITVGLPAAFASPLLGGGADQATETARDLGLGTSFENPLIMIALDWGALPAVALVASQVMMLLRARSGTSVPGGAMTAAVVVVCAETFSSIAVPGGLPTLACMLAGFAIEGVDSTARQQECRPSADELRAIR